MTKILLLALYTAWAAESCYEGEDLDILCPKANGQLILHSSTQPSHGHWQTQGTEICWKLNGGRTDSSCVPESQFPQALGFSHILRDSLPGTASNDGWIRMLRLPEDPQWAVMEILPIKSDIQSLWIQEDSSSVLVLRARTEWFKRWSSSQLLPALSEEFLRRWLGSLGQTCQRLQSHSVSPSQRDLQARRLECDLGSNRWTLDVHLREQGAATLILGYVRPENAQDHLQDLVDQIDFR